MREHRYYVYIVASKTGTLYIGMTNSLDRRMLQHKAGEIEGFASKYHCDRLVCCESFDDLHKAIGREKKLRARACPADLLNYPVISSRRNILAD